jgi:hypothetical protein
MLLHFSGVFFVFGSAFFNKESLRDALEIDPSTSERYASLRIPALGMTVWVGLGL